MLDPPGHRYSAWVAWEQQMLAKQYVAMERGEYAPTARQFYTGNASLRAEHLRAVGGFDPSLRRAEDVELAYRLADRGQRFHFVPEAVGYHFAERPYASWRNAAHLYGRNDMVFARHPARRWIYGFVADRLDGQPPLVRWTIQ